MMLMGAFLSILIFIKRPTRVHERLTTEGDDVISMTVKVGLSTRTLST